MNDFLKIKFLKYPNEKPSKKGYYLIDTPEGYTTAEWDGNSFNIIFVDEHGCGCCGVETEILGYTIIEETNY